MTPTNAGASGPGSSSSVLILGGSGFVGTRLATLLNRSAVPFLVGDQVQSEAFQDRWVFCDVRDAESLAKAIKPGMTIINLAAEHRDDVRPLKRYYETNVEGASHLCNAARYAGVERIVFVSSAAVYGFPDHPLDESGPFAPFNEYGKTKLAAEGIYRAWAAENTMRTLVIVRPTVIFGEGNRGNVYNLLRQIASGRFLMVGNGYNLKSMAYVENVAAFIMHTLHLHPGEHIFNYVDSPDMSTMQLVSHVRKTLGLAEKTKSIPKPVAMAAASLLDMVATISGRTFPISAVRVRKFCESTQFLANKAMASGFRPPYTLREGLTRTIESEFQLPVRR
jgi:nucleoside-diphosphate-sugar epimerase